MQNDAKDYQGEAQKQYQVGGCPAYYLADYQKEGASYHQRHSNIRLYSLHL